MNPLYADDERPGPRRKHDIAGLCLVFVGLTGLLWLVWQQSAPIPVACERAMRLAAGSACYVLPALALVVGAMLLRGFDRLKATPATWGTILLFLSFVAWRHLGAIVVLSQPGWASDTLVHAGGYAGAVIGNGLVGLIGAQGSYLFVTMMTAMGVVLVTEKPVIEMLTAGRQVVRNGWQLAGLGTAAARARRQEGRKSRAKRDVPVRPVAHTTADGEADRPRVGQAPVVNAPTGPTTAMRSTVAVQPADIVAEIGTPEASAPSLLECVPDAVTDMHGDASIPVPAEAEPSHNLDVRDDPSRALRADPDPMPDSVNAHEDALFQRAVRLVVEHGDASTVRLQRKLDIGYSRAARLVDRMEVRGIVGPLEGANPREVLVGPDDVEELFAE